MKKWQVTYKENTDTDGRVNYIINDGLEGLEIAEKNAKLIAAAPNLLEALREVATLVNIARLYFPKSMQNCNKFQLEKTNATINKAIAQAESE